MKKKSTEDEFDTQCWAFEIISDPYQVFAACFNFANISSFRNFITDTLLSIHKNKVYKKLEPSSVLHEFRIINSVINAAYFINHQKKKGPIDFSFGDLLDTCYYSEGIKKTVDWDCFPRTLTIKEYKDPYVIFKRFFKYQSLEKWRREIQAIIERVLSSYTGDLSLKLLPVYLHLVKLMEAIHLINVREITHINGYYKKLSTSTDTKDPK